MIQPTKYKSISYSELDSLHGIPINENTKQEATGIVLKFIDLFKLKHL